MSATHGRTRATIGGVLTGIGLGGFVDGIVLHQILQWHNMLSSVLHPSTMDAMKTNMTADGWFHAAVWLATLSGVLLLWSAAARMHVVPLWNIGFLLTGPVLGLVGLLLVKSSRPSARCRA